jgi:hypothetical protein
MADGLEAITHMLVRAQHLLQMPPAPPVRTSGLLGDETATALEHYRLITRLACDALEALRAPEGGAAAGAVAAAQRLLEITRLCVEEHTRICREDEAKRERSRRWSEVHAEFEAALREGRRMRSDWSWERHGDWQGPIELEP